MGLGSADQAPLSPVAAPDGQNAVTPPAQPAVTTAPADTSAPAQPSPQDAAINGMGGGTAADSARGKASMAPPPPSNEPSLFDKALRFVSGNPSTPHVDPTTGKMVQDPVTDRGALGHHILAAALVGMLKGAGVKSGPGSLQRAFSAGGEGEMDANATAKTNANNAATGDYNRQQQLAKDKQEADYNTTRTASLNMETAVKAKQQSALGAEAVQSAVALSAPLVKDYETASGQPLHRYGPQEMVNAMNSKDHKLGDGTVLDFSSGLWHRAEYTQYKFNPNDPEDADKVEGSTWVRLDPDKQIPLTSDFVAKAAGYGVPGFNSKMAASIPAGATMSVAAATAATNQMSTVDTMQHLANDMGDKSIDVKAKIAATPGLLAALSTFSKAMAASDGNIGGALKGMQIANPNSTAPAMISNLFGGDKAVKAYADKQVKEQKEAQETQEEKTKAKTEDQLKQQQTNTGKSEEARNYAEARKADSEESGTDWKPKVGQTEKTRANLAENINENGEKIKAIIDRRPDILGRVGGRITTTQQMLGTNDPDIVELGTRIQNLAKASVGVHGMRSYSGVEAGEKEMLNSFRNGPDAVKAGINAQQDSAQTFIDNARPEDSPYHSKNGGAAAHYRNLIAQSAAAPKDSPAAKVHANMHDFAHHADTKEHGTLYTDDNKNYFKQDGSVYTGGK